MVSWCPEPPQDSASEVTSRSLEKNFKLTKPFFSITYLICDVVQFAAQKFKKL